MSTPLHLLRSTESTSTQAKVVVGVGASAGGLEAMLLLFGHAQPNGCLAYVVAQHMAHDGHTALVARVIQRESALPVCVAEDRQRIEVDRVYLIPANHDGVVRHGVLHLLSPAPQRVSTPSVDVLLESIAHDFGPRACAVVLSGAGWDGSQGCRAVHRAGGLVIAQDPSEAGYGGMPEAVVEADCNARRMNAGLIGPWLARHAAADAHDPPIQSGNVATAPATTQSPSPLLPQHPIPESLSRVIERVREVTGIDFSEYREETLLRRLQSRRANLQLTASTYEALLMRDRHEAERLQRLFLVSLSSFWRDRHCFEALERALVPRLASLPPGQPVRVWVPGCASGEEVYTLAALLADLLERANLQRPIEVVGTDLNPEALEQAQAGEFPAKAFREAPSGWTDRWFIRQGERHTVRPELARLVRFEARDIEVGPPESWGGIGIDLISCRNLLIYFLPSKQERLLAGFHRALRPNGLLLIGPSESLGAMAQASFRGLDVESRLYVRRS